MASPKKSAATEAGGRLTLRATVLTGDYLAELTLMILLKDRLKDPSLGYARTFLRQLEEIATTCKARGIKIVVNAGGLNPAGLADAARHLGFIPTETADHFRRQAYVKVFVGHRGIILSAQ